MKKLKARMILLISSLAYFIAGALWRLSDTETILVDALNLLGLLLLLFGAIAIQQERKAERNLNAPAI